MKTIKRFFLIIFAGAMFGGVLFAWFSPYIIDWYFTSPMDNLILNCRPAMVWAIDSYRKAILAGTGIGAVLSLVLYLAFGLKSRPRAPKASEAGAPEEVKK